MIGSEDAWYDMVEEAEDLGLSIKHVMRRAGIRRSSMTHYLRGDYFPSPSSAAKIREKLREIKELRGG